MVMAFSLRCENSALSGAARRLRRSARRLGFVLEMFQQAWPAAVHVLAHGGARFRAQPLEVAMFQLYQGRIRSLRDEPDLDLGTHRGVRLPLAVEVPADHEALRRFP